jgi:hypothetical protein
VNLIAPVVLVAVLAALAPGSGVWGAAPGAPNEIPLSHEGGVYRVPVTIDGWLVRPFVVDSGAAHVQVSGDVFLALYPQGVPPPEFLPGASYRIADGRVISSRRFVIRSLRIGDYEFQQVPAAIGDPGAPLLLGQNVLGRLGTWSIDNRRRVLVLGEGARPAACLSWRTAPGECAVAAVRDHFRDAPTRYDVRSLVLLRSAAGGATVLADVTRLDGGRPPARSCGLIELRRNGAGWRVSSTRGLTEVGPRDRCLPAAPEPPRG